MRDHGANTTSPGARVTRAEPTELDDVDRELLNAVQWDFPLEARPYAALAVFEKPLAQPTTERLECDTVYRSADLTERSRHGQSR